MIKSAHRQAIRDFISVARPFFVSKLKWVAWGLLILLPLFSLAISGINVQLSYIGRDFMNSLNARDANEFYWQLTLYLIAFSAAVPVIVFYRYTEERLGLLWRRWLSEDLVKRYLKGRSFYRIKLEGVVDNPDQRLEADVRSFTAQSLMFFVIILNSLITLFAFVGILWSISITLVFAVIGYALIGSLATYYLGRPLIGLNFQQLQKDADYRYKLVNIRDNAESIAFYGDESKEFLRTRQKLKSAVNNLRQIINWNRNLNFFTTGYNYLTALIPTVIVAPLYIRGEIQFGVVTQAGLAFGQVLGSLSIIVQNFNSLSAFAAVVNRLGSFFDAVQENPSEVESFESGSMIVRHISETVACTELSIFAPRQKKPLIKSLTLPCIKGSLLITGPSGSGKSSLFRVIAGLWDSGDGVLWQPPLEDCFFLPQRPYMILGSLRNQLLYGLRRTGNSGIIQHHPVDSHQRRVHGVTDKELITLLETVGLADLLSRTSGGLDAVNDWPHLLSTGEQQRIACARLLLAKPKYVFLDEATTALDSATEIRFYNLFREITPYIISIGYRSTLAQFHDSILEFRLDGTYSLETKEVEK